MIAMKSKWLIPLILLLLVGVFFLCKGITGLVVSQSCCFETGANCAAENKCVIESPQNLSVYQDESSIYLGAMLVLVSALVYLILRREHHAHTLHNKHHK